MKGVFGHPPGSPQIISKTEYKDWREAEQARLIFEPMLPKGQQMFIESHPGYGSYHSYFVIVKQFPV